MHARRLAATASLGILAGALSGLFGVGGGILIVPGLVLLIGMEQRLAHGTSLAAVIPIALSAAAGFAMRGSVDWPAAGLLTAGAVAGVLAGSRILGILSQRLLRTAFAVFLLLTAARLLVRIPHPAGRGEIDLALGWGLLGLGVAAGLTAGILGVGAGIFMVPVLVLLLSVPDPVAKGTSLLVIIPTALAGTVANVRSRNADLPTAASVGLFGVAAGFGGSQIAVFLEPPVSSLLFAGLLVVVATRLLWPSRR